MGPWSFPTTGWLDVTDIGIGIVCLVPVILVIAAAAWDAVDMVKRRIEARWPVQDSHTFEIPGLGLTMADGGKPVEDPPKDS